MSKRRTPSDWLCVLFCLVAMTTKAEIPPYTLQSIGPYGGRELMSANLFANEGIASDHLFYAFGAFSPDAGETWRNIRPQLPGYVIWSVEDRSDPNTLYLGYYPGPFVRSWDGGTTFDFISAPFGEDILGGALAQDAAGTLYLQAGTEEEVYNLYSSRDQGTTWTRVKVKAGNRYIKKGKFRTMWADPVKPSMLYGYVDANPRDLFMVSTDGGKNWKERMNGIPQMPEELLFRGLCQSRVPPYSIYATLERKGQVQLPGVMRTDDRGKSWIFIKRPPGMGWDKYAALVVQPGTNDHLFDLGVDNSDPLHIVSGPMASEDGGRSWHVQGTILPSEGWTADQLCGWACPSAGNALLSITFSRAGNLIVTREPMGFLLSRDGGQTFKVHNGTGSTWGISSLLKAGDGAIYGAGGYYGDTWCTRDLGKTWRWAGFKPSISLNELSDGTVLGLDWTNALWAFKDGESRMVADTHPWGFNGFLKVVESLGRTRLVLATMHNDAVTFDLSEDMGATWAQGGTIAPMNGVSAISDDPRDPNCLIAAGWYGFPCDAYSPLDVGNGLIVRSVDGGETWASVGVGSKIGAVNALHRDPSNPDRLVASAAGGISEAHGYARGGVFVSEDGGLTWGRRSEGLPPTHLPGQDDIMSAVVSPPMGETLFAAVNVNGGFFRSDDMGRSWTKIADLPVMMPDSHLPYLCTLTITRSAVSQILPLPDGSFFASTMDGGVFKGTPAPPMAGTAASAPAPTACTFRRRVHENR